MEVQVQEVVEGEEDLEAEEWVGVEGLEVEGWVEGEDLEVEVWVGVEDQVVEDWVVVEDQDQAEEDLELDSQDSLQAQVKDYMFQH